MRLEKQSGFSLIELMLAMAIMLFILGSGAIIIRGFNKAHVLSTVESKVQQKLRSCADAVRGQAAGGFENMTELVPNDRTGEFDPDIKVWSTITPIDTASRTRICTLVAKRKVGDGPWNEYAGGNVRIATMTFTFSNLRGKENGAKVKIRVVEKGTSNGVAGVKLSARGQDIPIVTGQATDANGIGYVYGVYLTTNPSNQAWVKMDASDVRSYFENPVSFAKTVYFSDTKASQLKDLTNPPYEVVPPGSVTGTVLDVTNNNPVVGAAVHLHPDPATVVLEGAISSLRYTNDQGVYTFGGVIPGNYSVYLRGNDQYAALDKPNTAIVSYRTHYTVASKATVTIPTLYPIKRGSYQGQVRGITFDGANFVPGTPASNNVNMLFTRYPAFGYSYPSGTQFYFGNSISYAFGGMISRTDWNTAWTNSSGNYTLNYDAPTIVYDDNSNYPKVNQYSKVLPYLPNRMPSPFVSVLVWNPGSPSTTKFYVRTYDDGGYSNIMVTPMTASPAIDPSSFKFDVYTNALDSRNQNLTVYALQRSALSNVHGEVHFSPNVPPIEFTQNALTPDATAYITTLWGKDSAGNMGTGGVVYDVSNNALIKYNYAKSTFARSAEKHSFDLSNSAGNALIPDLGGDHTRVKFVGYSILHDEDKEFVTRVYAGEKYNQNGVGAFRWATPPNTPASITVSFSYPLPNGGWYSHGPSLPINLTFTGGTGNGSANHAVRWRNGYSAISDALTLVPGVDVACPDINVGDPAANYFTYYLSVAWTTEWAPNSSSYIFWRNPANLDQYIGQDIYLYRRSYAEVKGTVVDSGTGAPVTNATVSFYKSGIGYGPTQTLSGTNNAFNFGTNNEFIATPGDNLYLLANAPGYYQGGWFTRSSYNGDVWVYTIQLQKIPPPPPTGGGEPGGSG